MWQCLQNALLADGWTDGYIQLANRIPKEEVYLLRIAFIRRCILSPRSPARLIAGDRELLVLLFRKSNLWQTTEPTCLVFRSWGFLARKHGLILWRSLQWEFVESKRVPRFAVFPYILLTHYKILVELNASCFIM